MPCEPIDITLQNGRRIRGIVCSRGRRPVKVKSCQERDCTDPGKYLCDFPINAAGQARLDAGEVIPEDLTCSRRSCSTHVTEISADRHHCPRHTPARAVGQLDLL